MISKARPSRRGLLELQRRETPEGRVIYEDGYVRGLPDSLAWPLALSPLLILVVLLCS